MNPTKYRVETYIIPLGNNYSTICTSTKTDDAKITDKLKDQEMHTNDPEVNNIFNHETVPTIEASDILVQSFNHSSHEFHNSELLQTTNCAIDKVEDHWSTSNILTLNTVDETGTSLNERDADRCYHGCKSGCSAIIPAPEEVSKEIFQEHWLQKLEAIKKREAALKEKEYSLQNREEELSVREKEVETLERLLKDKMMQMESFIKQTVSLRLNDQEINSLDLTEIMSPTTGMNESVLSLKLQETCSIKSDPQQKLSIESILAEEPNEQISHLDNVINNKIEQSKIASCSSTVSLDNNIGRGSSGSQSKSSIVSKTSNSLNSIKVSSHGTKRTKRSQKLCYEDLDTTLSADIGDASFVQTSQKFDPGIYRKPYAFRRSVSERRVKSSDGKSYTNSSGQKETWYPTEMEQQKILQKVTKNISASKDKETKFQHYGLIDNGTKIPQSTENLKSNFKSENRYSYLNLEMGRKTNLRKTMQIPRERPASWNKDTNEWLERKRQAYNSATRKGEPENSEDKENLKLNSKKSKQKVTSKKKEITNRLFTIFR